MYSFHMNHTIPFTKLSKGDTDKAGGKGASLGEMTQAGIPVPSGYVVSAQTFEYFLKETDLIQEIDAILDTVDHNTIHTVEDASAKIQALILNAQIPEDIKIEIDSSFNTLDTKFVAVRSSATAEDGLDHAWAGQLDSYLNVKKNSVVEHVQKCWASLFTPRAIFYRFEKELHTTHISVAVVVQKMVNSDISGIAFSVHPVTENQNQLIIEAGFGLGEAIVSGQITPDSYVVEKKCEATKNTNILDININTQNKALYRKEGGGNVWKEFTEAEGSKRVLSEEQIKELSNLIIKIEDHYNLPQDIEWAMEGGEFFVVQSRPITTLGVEEDAIDHKKEVIKKEDWYHLGKWDGATLGAEVWFPYTQITKTFIDGDLNGGLVYLNGDFFLSRKDTEIYIKETYNHAKKHDIDYFNNLKNIIVEYADKLIEYSAKEKDIIAFLKKLQEFLGYWMPLNNMAIGLEKYVNEVDSNNFELATGSTCEKSWTLQQVDEMREIKSKIEGKVSYKDLTVDEKKTVDDHVKKYQWKGSHLFSVHNFSMEELFEQMQDGDSNQQDRLLENLNLEVQMLDILAFVRFRCAEAASMAVFTMYPIFKNVAEKNSLTYQELLEHTINEIDTEDFNKTRAQNRIVNKGFIYDGNITILNDQEIEEYKSILLAKEDVSEVLELKGLTAQKGKARGVVKIINNKNDVDGFEDGMVLVSYETTPDFAQIMKKSSAIVTNFGGLTSHAAIVAREFKVPCIVGTKLATEILKDGDEVEVDADNGIVRILNSKPKPENFVRMFAGKSFVYLLTDIFLTYYNSLGVLSIQDNSSWMSFLPKKTEEETLEEGKVLYESKERYQKYKEQFEDYIKNSSQSIELILEKDSVSKNDLEQFLLLVSEHFQHYSKTEFFYTDKIDIKKMIPSIKEFDELKLNGRSHLNKIIFEGDGYLRTLIKKLEKQTEVSESNLLAYSKDELIKLIEDGERVELVALENRKTFFASKDLLLFGNESKNLVDEFLSSYREESNIIKGTVAYNGKVTAKARVLLPDFEKFDEIKKAVEEMEQGEILVAETTSPEIIQACKKASAIITNQGGMLSHAAIVARELKIPCIIGTDRDVTRNIKTGDELEVDADNGIIKVIK